MHMPSLASSLAAIAHHYDAVLCDVWGVIHNGRAAFPEAVSALAAFRATGKPVILISNAPRPNHFIPPQLDHLGVTRDAWDAIVTSGDATRAEIAKRGRHVYQIGPDKDSGLYAGFDVEFVGVDRADYVVCTGPREELTETGEEYRGEFEALIARKLPMVCANPDKVVQFGGRLIPCAGALADIYEAMGGEVIMAGKPCAPIYALTYGEAEKALGRPVDKARILAIGDGAGTDVTGAMREGIDCLFVASGIHGADLRPNGTLEMSHVQQFLAAKGTHTRWAAEGLR